MNKSEPEVILSRYVDMHKFGKTHNGALGFNFIVVTVVYLDTTIDCAKSMGVYF